MSTPVGRLSLLVLATKYKPQNRNLEHYFHAARHLVWVVLETELSICLVATKLPSNADTNPREESLVAPFKTILVELGRRWSLYTPSRIRFSNGLADNK